MKLLVLLGLAASVTGLALPVRLLTTNEAPGVATVADTQGFWTTDIQIGTPGQKFNLIVDTWGDSIWVKDASCTQQFCYLYNPDLFFENRSSTYERVGDFDQKNHFGMMQGFTGKDTFIMGSIANKSTVLQTQFGQVNGIEMSDIAYSIGVDGVLGLGGPRNKNFMDDAFNQGKWKKNVVTYWLENQWETSDNGTNGVLYYGNYDPLHCNYSYSVPNTDSVLYKFTSTKFAVYNNGTLLYSSNQNRQTVLKSTYTHLGVPRTVFQQVLAALGLDPNMKSPIWVDCNLFNTLSFSFTNAKGTETVKGLNMVVPSFHDSCTLSLKESSPEQSGADTYELGIPFFRGRCTYLDRTQGTIGFGWPGTRVPGGK